MRNILVGGGTKLIDVKYYFSITVGKGSERSLVLLTMLVPIL